MPGILISLTMASYSCSWILLSASGPSHRYPPLPRLSGDTGPGEALVTTSRHRQQGGSVLCASCKVPRLSSLFKWKLNQEEGSFVRAIFDRDRALMLLDSTVRNRETKTGSRTDFFCSKEWIKNALFQPCWYPWAGITHTNIHDVRLPRACNGNDLAFRIGNGITRIGQQVDEHLLELDGVA